MQQLIRGIRHHRVRRQAVQTVFGLPLLRLESGKAELDGQTGMAGMLYVGDVSVDACGEGRQDLPCIGGITAILLRHVTPVPQAPRADVALNGRWAEDFGKAPLSRALPQFDLEQTILCRDETLCEEQVVLITRIDMGDAPTVALHAHGMVQTRHVLGATDDREAVDGALLPVRTCGFGW